MALVEVKVPDIGDFKDVEIIELLVKPGDRVKAEQSLVTVESDKASMEIPSSHGRRRQGDEGQARRQGQRRDAAAGARRRGRAACAGARHRSPRSAAPAAAASGSQASLAPACASGRAAGVSGGVVEVNVPDIGDFAEVVGHRGFRQAGRHGQGRAEPDHRRERQGVDGDSVLACRRRQGREGQGRRQGSRRASLVRAGARRAGGAAPAPAQRRLHPGPRPLRRGRRAAPAAERAGADRGAAGA